MRKYAERSNILKCPLIKRTFKQPYTFTTPLRGH